MVLTTSEETRRERERASRLARFESVAVPYVCQASTRAIVHPRSPGGPSQRHPCAPPLACDSMSSGKNMYN